MSIYDATKLQAEIDSVQTQIAPLVAKLEQLREEKRKADSRAFIHVNKIKREDIEFSGGSGKPWFGTVFTFAEWLKSKTNRKRWSEWNGNIYRTDDLIAGRMTEERGRVSELPE